MQRDDVQVKAQIPRALKREMFVRLTAEDEKFSNWLRRQMRAWLRERQPQHPEPHLEAFHAPAE